MRNRWLCLASVVGSAGLFFLGRWLGAPDGIEASLPPVAPGNVQETLTDKSLLNSPIGETIAVGDQQSVVTPSDLLNTPSIVQVWVQLGKLSGEETRALLDEHLGRPGEDSRQRIYQVVDILFRKLTLLYPQSAFDVAMALPEKTGQRKMFHVERAFAALINADPSSASRLLDRMKDSRVRQAVTIFYALQVSTGMLILLNFGFP